MDIQQKCTARLLRLHAPEGGLGCLRGSGEGAGLLVRRCQRPRQSRER